MAQRPHALAACACAAMLLACSAGTRAQPRELPMTRVQAGWAVTDLRQTYTVRTEAQWRNAWQVHEPATIPRTERVAVDFSRRMVLGLTQGSAPNGCHALAIRRVVEQPGQLQVQYRVSRPQPGALCTDALVPLTDFVVVERIDKPVTFVQTAD